jgi:glucans biosynthesis protein
MDRRRVLKFGAGLSSALLLAPRTVIPAGVWASPSDKAAVLAAAGPKNWGPFSAEMLFEKARQLSQAPYSPPEDTIPGSYKSLSYDQYRAIRFEKDFALWKGENLGFAVEFFPAGYIYRSPVEIFVVEGDRAAEFAYVPELFSYGPTVSRPPENSKPGFSGFRIHTAINRPDVLDEFAVFQGASYFRSKTAGQDYGLSARGLAINTAQPPADEFPFFRAYWIVKPTAGAKEITIYALLDSASTTGIYKFVISQAYNTIMDVDATLFPRKTLPYAGIAPLTSMFWFSPGNPVRGDEARPRIHDSDGLLIWNGKGERIWRPLINCSRVQFSGFADDGLKGFGLLQRERRADRYEDFDAHYELRPSLWVEPKEEWGEGTVDLVELPTLSEYQDNIVVFWRPKVPLEPGKTYSYLYRLTWCYEAPIRRNVATVAQTLTGASTQHEGMRLFYVDFAGTEDLELCDDFDDFCADKLENVELSASAGTIVNVALRRNKVSGGHRVGFEFLPPAGATQADLRCALVSDGKPVSEIWIYRWTA